MTDRDLFDYQRELSESLADLLRAIPRKRRNDLAEEIALVEKTVKHGIAAIFLLDWLWKEVHDSHLGKHVNADQVVKLLQETRAASREES